MTAPYRLFCRPGWGSAIVEAQLAWYGLACDIEDVDNLFESAAARAKLAVVNPLAQVPTLVLPGGTILTESAAITLHLADATGSAELVPRPQEAERPAFLRWLIFLVANIYPTFTYADDPARFVPVEAAQKPFRRAVDDYAQKLWRQVETACGAPHFLGARFSALALYAAIMTRWRPRRPWFAEQCPKLHAAAAHADAKPRLAPVRRRNWPKE